MMAEQKWESEDSFVKFCKCRSFRIVNRSELDCIIWSFVRRIASNVSVEYLGPFETRSQNIQKQLLPLYICLSVCPSVRPSALNNSSPHWMDFFENFYFSTFPKYVGKIQHSLISYKNNRYSTCRRINIYDNISLILHRMRNVSDDSCKENRNTF